jgi:hypothetical protein
MIVIAGGRQARPAGVTDRDHRTLYDAACLVWIDPEKGSIECSRLENGSRIYKGLRPDGEGFLAAAEDRVHRLDTGGVVLETSSHPDMDDVHDAVRIEGHLLVASTGVEAVLDLDAEPPRRISCDVRSHPNHVVHWHGRRLVTRGDRGDLLDLDDRRGFPVADVVIHDGTPGPDGLLWLTAVDGRLIDRPEPLGWCRGLAFDGGLVWVGFTRIRATRARERLAWVRGALRGRRYATRRPTRVVAYTMDPVRVAHTVELAGHGMDALCAIASVAAGDVTRPASLSE